jgi:DNA repair protein RecN (Recombination protein N)
VLHDFLSFFLVLFRMLQHLSIQDFTLITSLNLDFGKGLNIITGETGAGKSIIVDALLLLFGERGSADFVRKGAPKAIIEGTFKLNLRNKEIYSFLQQHDFDEAEDLVMRREISEKGSSRSFINDTPATLMLTRELGNLLVDFHGQHEHQSLLRADEHINFVDALGVSSKLIQAYSAAYHTLRTASDTLEDLLLRQRQLREQEEFKRFQLKEIEDIDPRENEDEDIRNELRIRESAERLSELTGGLYGLLTDDEDSLRERAKRARKSLDEIAVIDASFADLAEEFRSVIVTIDEVSGAISDYRDNIDFDAERLEQLRYRLQQLSRLRKKFGSITEVLAKRSELERDLSLVDTVESEAESLRRTAKQARKDMAEHGAILTAERVAIARKAEQKVMASLKHLGMEKTQFAVQIGFVPATTHDPLSVSLGDKQTIRANSQGLDTVEFMIAANPGEPLRPLVRIASGGEISRVMLALKTALASEPDKLPMMVFDEIDTGISGRIAQKAGQIMKDLSSFHQIIVITHLPQIAALADWHIMVEKFQSDSTTSIHAHPLDAEQHIREVARLLSGETITESALQSARELSQFARA